MAVREFHCESLTIRRKFHTQLGVVVSRKSSQHYNNQKFYFSFFLFLRRNFCSKLPLSKFSPFIKLENIAIYNITSRRGSFARTSLIFMQSTFKRKAAAFKVKSNAVPPGLFVIRFFWFRISCWFLRNWWSSWKLKLNFIKKKKKNSVPRAGTRRNKASGLQTACKQFFEFSTTEIASKRDKIEFYRNAVSFRRRCN